MADFVNRFGGTASAYVRYRPAYPTQVWDLLVREAKLAKDGLVLDLGSGPGTASLHLARRAAQVTAVDADRDMLEEGRRAAAAARCPNITWVHTTAEDFVGAPGTYRLVVIASAFHWMDRAMVAAKCHRLLVPTGLLALVGLPTPLVQIREREGVGAAIAEVQDRWFHTGYFPLDESDLVRPEAVLREGPFGAAEVVSVPVRQTWDAERFIGFLRSTSSRPDQRLGNRFEAFAREVEQAIYSVEPDGQWTFDTSVEIILSRKAADP